MDFNNEFPGNTFQSKASTSWIAQFRDRLESAQESSLGGEEYLRLSHSEPHTQLERKRSAHSNMQSFDTWVASLSGLGWEMRMEAFRRLEAGGIDACLKALYDLRHVGGKGANHVRVAAIEVLGSLGELAPIEPLIVALADPFWDVRAAAAQALGKLGEYVPVEFFVEVLNREEDESVREAIVRSLGRQGERMPVEELVSRLCDDESWLVRQAAAWALGELHEHTPTKWLIHALQYDTDESVRAAAARALGQSRDQRMKRVLYQALLDPEKAVREAVKEAIEYLDGELSVMRYNTFYQPASPAAEVDTNPGGVLVADTVPERAQAIDTDPERAVVKPLLLDKGKSPSSPKASPVWEEAWKEQILRMLTDFLKDKRGDVGQPRMLLTEQGPLVLLTCLYQHSSLLKESVLQSVQATTAVEPIEDALISHDETVGLALKQAFETWGERPWEDLLIVSFVVSHHSWRAEQGSKPLRFVVTGMGGRKVRREDTPVLRQIITAWNATVAESVICQRPQDLVDLKIWYQTAPSYGT